MNKEEMFKTSKGITLIALVITIIILIILAGVSINLTIGQEGIITKSQKAKEDYEESAISEKLELVKISFKLQETELTIDSYLEKLEKSNIIEFTIDERVNEKTAYIIVNNKFKYLLENEESADLKITYLGIGNSVLEETNYQLKYVVTYYKNHNGFYTCNLKKYRLDTEEILFDLDCNYVTYNNYADSFITNVLSEDAQWRWSFTPLVDGTVYVLYQGNTYTFVEGENKSGAWNYGSEYGGSANTIVPYVGNGDITVTFITENKYSE